MMGGLYQPFLDLARRFCYYTGAFLIFAAVAEWYTRRTQNPFPARD